MAIASITFGQVLLTVLEIALLALWIWVAASVITDIFRSPDLSNAAKAGWMLIVIGIPLLGVMIYVIARGDRMKEHDTLEDMQDRATTGEDFQRAQSRRRDPMTSGG
jgi:hypothetical protein